MAQYNKDVTFTGKVVSAATIDDFYSRLNALRTYAGIAKISVPVVKDEKVIPSQAKAVYDQILATKNAISFLKNVTLKTSFAGVSTGDLLKASNSVSILEQNIGQLEAVCRAYYSSNKNGYNASTNYTGNNAPYYTPNANQAPNASNNNSKNSVGNSAKQSSNDVSNLVFSNKTNRSSFNGPFYLHANTSDRSSSNFLPHHGSGSGSFSSFDGAYGHCSRGRIGCRAVTKRNSNESAFNTGNFSSRQSTNYSANNSGKFATHHTGNFSTNFGTYNTSVHSAVKSTNKSSDFSSAVFSSNKTANNVGVSASYEVVWGTYHVEGLTDL